VNNIQAKADAVSPECFLANGTIAHVVDRIEDGLFFHATPLVDNSRNQEAYGLVAGQAIGKRLGVVHLGVFNFKVANVDHDKPVDAVALHGVLHKLVKDLLVDPEVDTHGWRYFV
jgi:hypothetical protein